MQITGVNLVKDGLHKLVDKVEVTKTSACTHTSEKVCVVVNQDAGTNNFTLILIRQLLRTVCLIPFVSSGGKKMKVSGPNSLNPYKIIFEYTATSSNAQGATKTAALYFGIAEGWLLNILYL